MFSDRSETTNRWFSRRAFDSESPGGLAYEAHAELTPDVGSDHASFIEAGIPSIIFNCFCDPNYHTAGDRFEFVQKSRLRDAGALGLGVAQTLLQGAAASATNSP